MAVNLIFSLTQKVMPNEVLNQRSETHRVDGPHGAF
jgi:hypothetical protein